MSILDHFPKGFTPMPEQAKLLLEVEEVWDDSDVIVVDSPVGSGKSLIAMTLLSYANGGSYAVPSNVLLDQIENDFPQLPILRARDYYLCGKGEGGWTCEQQAKKHGNCRECPKVKAEIRSKTTKFEAMTYWGLVSNKKYRNLVILDEAHLTTDFLRTYNTKVLPKSQYHWPDPATPETLHEWTKAQKKRDKDAGRLPNKAVTALQSNLNKRSKSSIAYRTKELSRGYMDDVIKVVPGICSGAALWPGHKVSKLVLMSATISDLDLLQLGLSTKRVSRVISRSPIPPSARPLRFTQSVSVTWENRTNAARELANSIYTIAQYHENEAGIIHLPYSLAKEVGAYFKGNPRYIFHGKDDKQESLARFLQSGNGIFLASGFAEGLSLSYEKARFNVITKTMYPNNQDPFVQQINKMFPTWASEQAVKTLLQSYGRTSRRPDDFSMTYVLDTMAFELYKKQHKLFPQWFKDAVVF